MYKFTCSECGSANVSSKCWADPNTDEIGDYVSNEPEDNWCEECQRHVKLTTTELYDVFCKNCGVGMPSDITNPLQLCDDCEVEVLEENENGNNTNNN